MIGGTAMFIYDTCEAPCQLYVAGVSHDWRKRHIVNKHHLCYWQAAAASSKVSGPVGPGWGGTPLLSCPAALLHHLAWPSVYTSVHCSPGSPVVCFAVPLQSSSVLCARMTTCALPLPPPPSCPAVLIDSLYDQLDDLEDELELAAEEAYLAEDAEEAGGLPAGAATMGDLEQAAQQQQGSGGGAADSGSSGGLKQR